MIRTIERAKTHYEVFMLDRHADAKTIRTTMRDMLRKIHPDKCGAAGLEATKRVNEAYDVLKDPDARAAYDLELDAQSEPPKKPKAKPRAKKPAARPRAASPKRAAPEDERLRVWFRAAPVLRVLPLRQSGRAAPGPSSDRAAAAASAAADDSRATGAAPRPR